MRNHWYNIVLPNLIHQENENSIKLPKIVKEQNIPFKQGGSYMFFALEPNTEYQVQIQARNRHGWGKFSTEFLFTTRSTGEIHLVLYNLVEQIHCFRRFTKGVIS